MDAARGLNGRLIKHLIRGTGFTPTAKALSGLAAAVAQEKHDDWPHTIADILAHLEFWQRWTLANIHGKVQPVPAQAALGWPEAPTWGELLERFLTGLEAAQRLCDDEDRLQTPLDPESKIGAGFDKLSVGEALLEVVAFHNAHHLGQIILLRRMLGAWPPAGGGVTW